MKNVTAKGLIKALISNKCIFFNDTKIAKGLEKTSPQLHPEDSLFDYPKSACVLE